MTPQLCSKEQTALHRECRSVSVSVISLFARNKIYSLTPTIFKGGQWGHIFGNYN